MTLYEALGDETVTWSHEEEGQQEIFKESIDNGVCVFLLLL